MRLVRPASLLYQPPVPPPKVVPLPTSEGGTGRTAHPTRLSGPYQSALPTLEIRGCGDRGRGGARGTAGAPSAHASVWLRAVACTEEVLCAGPRRLFRPRLLEVVPHRLGVLCPSADAWLARTMSRIRA